VNVGVNLSSSAWTSHTFDVKLLDVRIICPIYLGNFPGEGSSSGWISELLGPNCSKFGEEIGSLSTLNML